ncbi:ethylene-responsive transcription factor erf025, partial [Phtheirospermum japonicum]
NVVAAAAISGEGEGNIITQMKTEATENHQNEHCLLRRLAKPAHHRETLDLPRHKEPQRQMGIRDSRAEKDYAHIDRNLPLAGDGHRRYDVAALDLKGRDVVLNFPGRVASFPAPSSPSPQDIQRAAAGAAEMMWTPESGGEMAEHSQAGKDER